MRLRKVVFVIVFVFIFLLNDPQILRAHSLKECSKETQQNTIDPFMGADSAAIHLVYELNGGINSNYNPRTLKKEDLPITLDVPVKEGYNFAGWYTDTSYRQKITEINETNAANMVLFAKWTREIDNHYNVEMYAYSSASMLHKNQKELKECSYDFLEHVEIPGMPATREQDYLNNLIQSDGQCLQGICFTSEFMLITSYSEDSKQPGSLMIFERETGEYLATLGMKTGSHLGGIAYDGENVWICHSNTNSIERISYDYIQKIAADNPKGFVDASGLSDEYKVKNIPSCITAYGGRIWIATHTQIFNSQMLSYNYSETDDKLVALSSYQIPNKVQGVAFDQNGAVYLSTSYGRNNSSYLKVYSSLLTLNRKPNEPARKIEMPPCSEELVVADEKVYVLFESASRKYFEGTDGKGTSSAPIDKVLEVAVASIW